MNYPLLGIYHEDIPDFIRELCETAEMQRIRDIDMNCGMSYTSFPLFKTIKSYSRFDHSVGTALIVYHFTKSKEQAVAALFHDIAAPVFSHVVDFVNQDHEKQESTELYTKDIIRNSAEIAAILKKYSIPVAKVTDYHLYPIADNELPQLCADRLEYLLGGMYFYGFIDINTIRCIYENIAILQNEYNIPELSFQNVDIALKFSNTAMKCCEVYICDNDRYAMEYLARLLKKAIVMNIIRYDDFYSTETYVISKIRDSVLNEEWLYFTQMNMTISVMNKIDPGYFMIKAKKRFINPCINGKRLTTLNKQFEIECNKLRNLSFNYYVKGVVI